jgi:hypothetical protein
MTTTMTPTPRMTKRRDKMGWARASEMETDDDKGRKDSRKEKVKRGREPVKISHIHRTRAATQGVVQN